MSQPVESSSAAPQPQGGTCRFCACAGDCLLQDGDECGWVTPTHDVCTNPACVRKYTAWLRSMPRRKREQIEQMVRPIRERWAARERKAVSDRRKVDAKRRKQKGGSYGT
jgi:hypothetical protein